MWRNILHKKNNNVYIKYAIQIFVFIAVLAAAFWLAIVVRETEGVKEVVAQYGYGGVFFVSLLSGFNLVSSVPVIAFVPIFLVAGLKQWLVVLVITAGVTMADVIAYSVGRVGKRLLSDRFRKTVKRLEKLRERHSVSLLVILFFFAAFVPLPNEVLVVPMAFLGYRLRYMLLPLMFGNLVFNSLGSLGIVSIFELL